MRTNAKVSMLTYVIRIKNSREIWTTTIAVKNDGWCSQLWCYLARWKVFSEAGKRTFILRKLEKERKGTACGRRKATQHVYETKEYSKRKVSTVSNIWDMLVQSNGCLGYFFLLFHHCYCNFPFVSILVWLYKSYYAFMYCKL